MRAVQNQTLPINALEAESKFCLGCRACEPVCPAGVEYGHLIEEARAAIWVGDKRPKVVKQLFFALKFLKFKNFFHKSRATIEF